MKIIKILSLLLLALPSMALGQGLSASKCLAEAPDAVIPVIDRNTRLDMIDYFTAGLPKASVNRLGGQCSIVEMTDSSATFMLTDSISCQLFVLNPASTAPIIGIITTYADPIADSSVQFYNSRWQPLAGVLAEPGLADWLTPEGKRRRALVEEELPFILAAYRFIPEQQMLVAVNNTARYFAPADSPQALGLLKPELAYRWDGKRFKPASR